MELQLNNGVAMPALGFGVYQIPPEDTAAAVAEALRVGYRLIDTAAVYGNERAVGEAIRDSGIPRDEIFIETKVWISDYGYEETLHAFDKSAAKLGVDTIDLLLLHQALTGDFEKTLAAYRALEKLLASGRVRAIGVSNFMVNHLQTLRRNTNVTPAVNQIEVHPFFHQRQVHDLNAALGIVTQAWSPIGGITDYSGNGTTSTFEAETIRHIADEVGRTPAQVMLAWHLQQGRAAIPKSVTPERIAENFQIFDMQLTSVQIAALDDLETGQRGGPEPEDLTLETAGKDIPEA